MPTLHVRTCRDPRSCPKDPRTGHALCVVLSKKKIPIAEKEAVHASAGEGGREKNNVSEEGGARTKREIKILSTNEREEDNNEEKKEGRRTKKRRHDDTAVEVSTDDAGKVICPIKNQCQERGDNHLHQDICKEEEEEATAWTYREDRTILEYYLSIGKNWDKMAKLLPGRTEYAIKEHWNVSMKEKIGKYLAEKKGVTSVEFGVYDIVGDIGGVLRAVRAKSRPYKKAKEKAKEQISRGAMSDRKKSDATATLPLFDSSSHQLLPTTRPMGQYPIPSRAYLPYPKSQRPVYTQPNQQYYESLSDPNYQKDLTSLYHQDSSSAAAAAGCTCKRSRCLKKYCHCFAQKSMCSASCSCVACMNTPSPSNEKVRVDVTAAAAGCMCKRSRCLKKYCQCFALKSMCSASCRCVACMNTPSPSNEKVRVDVISRNMSACDGAKGGTETKTGNRVKCKCRKSACIKKYCDCYSAGVKCSLNCRCMGCKNPSAAEDEKDADAVSVSSDQEKAATAKDGKNDKVAGVSAPSTELAGVASYNSYSISAGLLGGLITTTTQLQY